MIKDDTIGYLNELIQVCKSGEYGYQTAAANVRNSQLETVFTDYAKQRAGCARQLQAEVERLGGTPADSGTMTAAVHRGWIDLKSALTGSDAGAIVAACETGEESALAAFERVANYTDVSGETRVLVEKQWHKVQEAQKRMLRLREEIAGGAEYPDTGKKAER